MRRLGNVLFVGVSIWLNIYTANNYHTIVICNFTKLLRLSLGGKTVINQAGALDAGFEMQRWSQAREKQSALVS